MKNKVGLLIRSKNIFLSHPLFKPRIILVWCLIQKLSFSIFLWCRCNSLLSYKYAAMQMRVILCNHFAWKLFPTLYTQGSSNLNTCIISFPFSNIFTKKNLTSNYNEKSWYFFKYFLSSKKSLNYFLFGLSFERHWN